MTEYREKIIQNYIDGYNEFDVDKMTFNFDDNIIFKNIQNDQVNMTLNGIMRLSNKPNKQRLILKADGSKSHLYYTTPIKRKSK